MTSPYNIQQGDCLELMKGLADCSVDLIFCDPPYALGSEVIIKADGKPEYKKAVDFMNKWDQPDGTFWEEWFCEAKRVLKHGGHCLMFGMDRQLWFNCYYANLAGFTQKQSLYWYFISNFPKASDLSKQIEKNAGVQPIGSEKPDFGLANKDKGWNVVNNKLIMPELQTDLAKKYEGIKYSVAPLKQTNETIMVFQKPYKTGSCLHDVLALENGDDTITCGGVDIEGNRCGVEKITTQGNSKGFQGGLDKIINQEHNGRFPAQTYIDTGASEIIDLQSGVQKSQQTYFKVKGRSGGMMGKEGKDRDYTGGHNDSGEASRILHKCDFEAGDYDLYHYCPKVSKSERNEGLEGFEEKQYSHDGRNKEIENPFQKNKSIATNNHPTVKPKALLSKILKLFKTPNDQVLLDPFMGSGSMGISAVETGFEYIGYELDQEYYKIAENRMLNAQNQMEQILV